MNDVRDGIQTEIEGLTPDPLRIGLGLQEKVAIT